MVNYRYLGYGITNEQGIAHLDHDANGDPIDHSYTGTGAGELDIIASLDDQSHISDSSIQSETYEVWDCFTFDSGIDGSANEIWDTYKCEFDRGAEYSEISETTEYGFIRTKQANAIPKNCIIEFDYMNVDGAMVNNMFGIYSSENAYITIVNFLYLGNLSIGAWHHIKFKIENNVMTVTNNTNSTVYTRELTIPTANILFLFLTQGDTTKARFKDFKAYSV